MSQFPSRLVRPALTLLLGTAAFFYWWLRCPALLTYHEQFQLFLFDGDYLCSRLSEPGGVARYVAEFLAQFYNIVALGALIIALLYMGVQWLTWRLLVALTGAKDGPAGGVGFLLSFVPVLLLWQAMGSENVMLAYGVALLLALAVAVLLAVVRPANRYVRWAVTVVAMPVGYWLAGPLALVPALCLLPLSALVVVGCILLCAHVLPYPLTRLFLGLSYFRHVQTLPYLLMAIPTVVVLLAWAARWAAPRLAAVRQPRLWMAASLAVVAGVAAWVPAGLDARTYSLIEYDYLVRTGNWNAIISKSEQQQPDLPMSVCATNLALAMTNQLGDRAFSFFQHGSDGLFPLFERNFATLQVTGEVYFQLGLINTAQRYAFETMEALPNYNKSCRVVKRLAETNLINGQYEVARKYLHLLEKTVFYQKWAQRTEALLGHEDQINAHPLYGKLRSYRLEEDYLFSEREIDKICGQLFVHNPNNQLAMQYLLMHPLMQKDIDTFMRYMQVVQPRVAYNARACQEGVAFAFMKNQQPVPKGLISPMTERSLNEFGSIYNREGKDSPRLEAFRQTLWYYLLK